MVPVIDEGGLPADPTPPPGPVTDPEGHVKIGDGVTPWSELPVATTIDPHAQFNQLGFQVKGYTDENKRLMFDVDRSLPTGATVALVAPLVGCFKGKTIPGDLTDVVLLGAAPAGLYRVTARLKLAESTDTHLALTVNTNQVVFLKNTIAGWGTAAVVEVAHDTTEQDDIGWSFLRLNAAADITFSVAQTGGTDNYDLELYVERIPEMLGVTTSYQVNATADTQVDASATVAIDPSATIFPHGQKLTITATASTGYHFDAWTGDSTSTENPLVIYLDGPKDLIATFAAD